MKQTRSKRFSMCCYITNPKNKKCTVVSSYLYLSKHVFHNRDAFNSSSRGKNLLQGDFSFLFCIKYKKLLKTERKAHTLENILDYHRI